jgi:hypothetical protein
LPGAHSTIDLGFTPWINLIIFLKLQETYLAYSIILGGSERAFFPLPTLPVKRVNNFAYIVFISLLHLFLPTETGVFGNKKP